MILAPLPGFCRAGGLLPATIDAEKEVRSAARAHSQAPSPALTGQRKV
jgi:hypothetical protein